MFETERQKLDAQLTEFFSHDLSILRDEVPHDEKQQQRCGCRSCTPSE